MGDQNDTAAVARDGFRFGSNMPSSLLSAVSRTAARWLETHVPEVHSISNSEMRLERTHGNNKQP